MKYDKSVRRYGNDVGATIIHIHEIRRKLSVGLRWITNGIDGCEIDIARKRSDSRVPRHADNVQKTY